MNRSLLIPVVALALLVSACGDDDGDSAATATSPASSPPAATGSVPAPEPTAQPPATDPCATRMSLEGRALVPGPSAALDSTIWQLCNGGAAAGSSEKFLFRSEDSGAAWTLISRTTLGDPPPEPGVGALPNGNGVAAMGFISETTGFLGLTSPGQNLFRSTDGGANWTAAPELPPGVPVTSIEFTSPQDGTAVTSESTWTTADGGETWTESAN